MRLDLRPDVGVPGWIDHNGRHVTLHDIATPHRIDEHRRACTLLALSLAKLRWELLAATTPLPPTCPTSPHPGCPHA